MQICLIFRWTIGLFILQAVANANANLDVPRYRDDDDDDDSSSALLESEDEESIYGDEATPPKRVSLT